VVKKSNKKGLDGSSIRRVPTFDIEDFYERINLLKNYCTLIETQEEEFQILMKNQLLVSLVTTIEYHLKAFFSYLIDDMDIEPKNILHEDSIEINLDVLKQLKTSNLTKGRIITAHLNTLKPSKLYSIMSRINNLDYFNWFDNITNSSKSYDEFRNLHDERNDIIHNFIDTQKSLKDLENTIVANSNICIHLVVFTQLNLGIFEKNWSSEKINRHYNSSFKSPPITIDKFKTITKKFRNDYVPQKPYFKK
jgi:hypothetical protein